MATKVIGKIVLYEPLSQAEIDAAIAGPDVVLFEIERRFQLTNIPQNLAAVLPVSFDDPIIDYIDALKNLYDAASFVHLQNAVVWKIKYDAVTKEFDLEDSYKRTAIDTTAAQTSLPNGQLLKAIFVTPGLDGAVQTIIDLPYNQVISNPHRESLLAVGIDLNLAVTGSLFSVKTQTVPYKVIFFQPDTVTTENYVIDFELQNKTIDV